MLNEENECSIFITDSSGDVSRNSPFFNSGSTKNFQEPHKKSIPKCRHFLKEKGIKNNSIYCDLLGWISPKACDTCRLQDFKRAHVEGK